MVSCKANRGSFGRALAIVLVTLAWAFIATPTHAQQQTDIPGPAGSTLFGKAVAVLPNGNIVASATDAVYLYSHAGVLISTLTGSSADDDVGSGGITVLTSGNFVVSSPSWNTSMGAVTWVDGNIGLTATVSASNSLVGSQPGDGVGHDGVTALSNGNYVVASSNWAGASADTGAVTWVNGNTGLSGAVSAVNSLVGAAAGDRVGSGRVVALTSGNYVANSPNWTNGAVAGAGAVTWADGSTGLTGAVSATNSLVGTMTGDEVGSNAITVLNNGNYVVSSPSWNGSRGAATWANGGTGRVGAVSSANSLVGNAANDAVSDDGVAALSNGNYVVASVQLGAATWANGSTGSSGTVSSGNSLEGVVYDDGQYGHIVALGNGNYVVVSPNWTNGTVTHAGAVTWANGSTGLVGTVSTANSLVGTTSGDYVGGAPPTLEGQPPIPNVTALSNGNYVIASLGWSFDRGAATWASGSTASTGAVSTSNSLVGNANDLVGTGVTALTNGNYVVLSPSWSSDQGAVTWANGSTGLVGVVSAGNSLTGDGGFAATALSNGNYIVVNPGATVGTAAAAGAVTWADGSTGLVGQGQVSSSNSLVGTTSNDQVGAFGSPYSLNGVVALSDGGYVVSSSHWNRGSILLAGAVSLGRANASTVGPIVATNSVRGSVSDGGLSMVHAYDAPNAALVVGQPAANVVSLFTYDPIFANGFE